MKTIQNNTKQHFEDDFRLTSRYGMYSLQDYLSVQIRLYHRSHIMKLRMITGIEFLVKPLIRLGKEIPITYLRVAQIK